MLLLQFWNPDCMSAAELRKLSLQQTREAFQRREGDCGSSEVQGACVDLHSIVGACHDTCGANAMQYIQIPNELVSVAVKKSAFMQSKLVAYLPHSRLGSVSSFNVAGGCLQWLL